MTRWPISPLHRGLERCFELGLGHRPDPDDAGRHLAACPVCGVPDALVITEPDDFEPVDLRCADGCNPLWVTDGLNGVDPLDQLRAPLRRAHGPSPALLRRQAELLVHLAAHQAREAS